MKISTSRLVFVAVVVLCMSGCDGGTGATSSSSSGSSSPPPAPPATTNYPLTVTVTGAGTVSAGGITCPGDCTESYSGGTITLTAVPTIGHTVSWTGCDTTNGNTCTVAMSAARTVTVTFTAPLPTAASGVRIFYTDIVTGPNRGGENDNGTYLSIFGTGFGNDINAVSVTVGSGTVARKIYLGASKGRADVQQLSVQVGSAVSTGAVVVTVGGVASNSNIGFTVRSGNIYFVSRTGNDSTGAANDIARPYRTVTTRLDNAAAGDTIVVRGGTWNDAADSLSAGFSFHNVGGSPGAPVTLMAYPGETALIRRTGSNGMSSGIRIYSGSRTGYMNISGFDVDMAGGGSACISLGSPINDIRVVNNNLYGMFENGGGSAGIDGSGQRLKLFGNHVHDNGGSKLYHAIYMDARDTSGPDDIEIAYNHIHHQTGGRGIQIYGDTNTRINNVRVHHNLIHHIHLDGIVFHQDSGTGFQAYNNVVYHVADPAMNANTGDDGATGGCLRFASPYLVAEVYNNTFHDCAADNSQWSGALRFDAANQATLRNNIISGKYMDLNALPATFVSSNNLWFGGGAVPSWESAPTTGDPRFVNTDASAGALNFHLQPNSPAVDHGSSVVSAIVTTDYDGIARPQGQSNLFDIGAHEYK